METTQRPRVLTVVALVFLLEGIGSVVALLAGVSAGKVELSTGLLDIPTAIGLLHFRAAWRVWALACSWFGLLVVPLITGWALVNRPPVSYGVFGVRMTHGESWLPWAVLGIGSALVSGWQLWVLTRPEIRARFAAGR